MANENPFKSWTQQGLSAQHGLHSAQHGLHSVDAVDVLEASMLNASAMPHLRPLPTHPRTLEATTVTTTPVGLSFDSSTLEQLAGLIADNLSRLFEQNNLFADRVKLEELKVDNQLMARHIYSLLQKRGIQDKQVEHLQREQKRWKKLFWKFYLRDD